MNPKFSPAVRRLRPVAALLAVALGACAVRDRASGPQPNAPQSETGADAIAAIEPSTSPLGGNDSPLVADANAPLRLQKPIACNLGDDCFVLLYPDRDPSTPNATDYTCGQLSYDDHKGTDFAIRSWNAATNVPVVASAPGTVTARRDGMDDRRLSRPEDRSTVSGVECGNGVMVDHGNGWSTQYCHMKKGSVSVQQGDRVDTGTPLGQVGLSGMTTFPHVHITVRRGTEVVDPFIGPDAASGCNVSARSPLWSEPIPYQETGIVRAGVAPKPVTEDDSWGGLWQTNEVPGNSQAFIFWVHSYGLRTGDVEHFDLFAPDGRQLVNHQETLKADTKNRVVYVGQGTRYGPLQTGTWRAKFRLVRNGKTITEVDRIGIVK